MKYFGKGSVSSFLSVVLAIAWYACLVGALGMLAGAGVSLWHGFPSNGQYTIDAGPLEFVIPASGHDSKAIMFGLFSIGFISLGFALVIIHQLRKVFRDLCSGAAPFTSKTAERVRSVGWFTIIGAVLQGGCQTLVGFLISSQVTIPGVELNVKASLNMGLVFTGLIILVLAEIFRHGTKLQEEQDLTV